MPNVTPLRPEDPQSVGRHRLTGRISGMPGSGPYYLATGAHGTEVVLRLLRGHWTRDGAARDRFTAEAAAAQRVPPFCVARILDAGIGDGFAYLVCEYVSGKSLLETVSDDGRLRGPQLEALAIGSVTGLASVHEAALVHGNFGPEHVIMSAAGPCLIEFGITPPYGSATPAADMLAWAQTMVFASAGRPPATLADLDVLPPALRQAVADGLAGDPALRPAARSVVRQLLGESLPPAGALAEGSRRAAEAAAAGHGAAPEWESPPPGGTRPGPGGRAGRPHGHHHGAQPARPRRPDRGRPGAPDSEPQHSAGRTGVRRIGLICALAAVVVIVIVAVVIVHLRQGGGSPADQAQGSDRAPAPSAGATSPVSSTVTAPPTAVPPAFAGTWTGTAMQVNPTDVYQVKVVLPAATAVGSIYYSSTSFSCGGTLSLAQAGTGTISLTQGIVTGRHACLGGLVTLHTDANGTLEFSFRGKHGPGASGTLTRA